ncbi:MAG: hypothetical protein HYY16_17190 [Planctomycetes bacterium]|nr:hypothetical protein [Planctomycetota bacterium]
MKTFIVGLTAGILVLASVGCGVPASKAGSGTAAPVAGKQYACPMGCATAPSPGNCPKCGMEMVEKK